jgi:hypothetical protein
MKVFFPYIYTEPFRKFGYNGTVYRNLNRIIPYCILDFRLGIPCVLILDPPLIYSKMEACQKTYAH